MLSKGLQKWQQENTFRIGGDTVYGVHRGVGFSVVEEDGGKLFVFMLAGEDSAFDNCEDMLAGSRGDLKLVQVGDVENYLALCFDEQGGEMSGISMSALLDFVADNYRTCGFRVPNKCVKCGAPATKRSFLDNMVQPMCAECREEQKRSEGGGRAAAAAAAAPLSSGNNRYDDSYDEYAGMQHNAHPLGDQRRGYDERDEYDDRRERERRRPSEGYDEGYDRDVPRPGSVGGGVIGAILGALAGLVPFFGFVLLPFELSCLCFIAGFCATIGYNSFDGLKDRKTALTSVITATLVLSIFSVLLVSFINGFTDNFGTTVSMMFKESNTWYSLIFGVVGALLGVAISYDRLLKYIRS